LLESYLLEIHQQIDQVCNNQEDNEETKFEVTIPKGEEATYDKEWCEIERRGLLRRIVNTRQRP
jgi:hypothetical protein